MQAPVLLGSRRDGQYVDSAPTSHPDAIAAGSCGNSRDTIAVSTHAPERTESSRDIGERAEAMGEACLASTSAAFPTTQTDRAGSEGQP